MEYAEIGKLFDLIADRCKLPEPEARNFITTKYLMEYLTLHII